MIRRFLCEYCRKKFEDEIDCEIHEENCSKNPIAPIFIKVPCEYAIKDCHSYIASDCKYDACSISVRVERSRIEEIKKHQPYRYESAGSGILECISLTDPTFRFYGSRT